MSGYAKRRRKLSAHDRGDNRHAKAVAWVQKVTRVSNGQHSGRKPKPVVEPPPRIDVEPLAYDRTAERPSLAEQVAAWMRRGGVA